MKFEEKLIKLRKSNGMSQEELAEKLHVSRQAISRWEQGATMPDGTNLIKLGELFGVSIDYLLHDDYESDGDIPCVKETMQALSEADCKQSRSYLISAILWTASTFCFLMAAVIHFNTLHVVCAFLDALLACRNIYKYKKSRAAQ